MGQASISKLDFGKYNKQGKIKAYPDYLHELEHETFIDLAEAEVHYSRVFFQDTTSMSLNGYLIEFNKDKIDPNSAEIQLYSDYVSNSDWNLYRNYVKDSIARRILGEEMGADKWLVLNKDSEGKVKHESEWNLNWDEKINFSKTTHNVQFPYLSQMFYYPHARFNNEMNIDERKLNYLFYWIDFQGYERANASFINRNIVAKEAYSKKPDLRDYIIREISPVYRDSTIWIKDTSLNHFGNIEDGLVTHYNTHKEYAEMPVIGISQPQARSYLKWLELNHNKHLVESNAPYFVKYELPIVGPLETLPKMEIPSFELDTWMISNKQYKAFVEYVRDSIARRILGEEFESEGYLNPKYDNFLQELDKSEWNLNWAGKIDWSRKTSGEKYDKDKKPPYGILDMLYYPAYNGDTNLIDKRKLIFEYFFYDFKTASIEPRRSTMDNFDCSREYGYNVEKKCIGWDEPIDCFRGNSQFLGKDLDLSYVNSRMESQDVFSHEDRSNFIIRDKINIYPGINYRDFNKLSDKYCQWGNVYNYDNPCMEYDCEMCPQIEDWESEIPSEYDFDTNPDAPVQGLTYYQFRAYWWWWNKERRKVVKGNPVIADYIPSKDEFLKIQNGESVIHPKEVHELPSPTFNYVVKFYKIQPSSNN